MRKALFLICIMTIPCGLAAQSKQASWQNLNAIQVGEKIQVIEMNSTKDSGALVSVSDTAISLQAASGPQTIQRQDVRSVTLMKHAHRFRNTAIGAAVGAGAGGGIGAAKYRKCVPNPQVFLSCFGDFGRGPQTAVGAVIGLAGGAIVGVLWPSHKTIYRAKAA
jgi:hypothetical protein